MSAIETLFPLFKSLDAERTVPSKLDLLTEWAESLPEVYSMKIVSFDRSFISPGFESAYLLSGKDTCLFPRNAGVLNGKSPIPPSLFPDEWRKDMTVYYPITRCTGDLAGAVLLKCDSPRRFLKKQEATIGIIASKIHDLFELMRMRNKKDTGAGEENASDILTQEVLSRLTSMLKLPMYITDRTGRFIMVNDVFLKKFHYSSVEELNSGVDFFITKDNWKDGIENITSDDETTGLTIHVRTGSGEICVAKDFATLIGKNTFGILIDITHYINVNEELEDSLETQKLLNERLRNTTGVLQKTQATAMKSLAALAEYRDKETGNHLRRICEYSRILGREVHRLQPYSFNISEDYVNDMYISSMLHDIGKVGVPDTVLLKPGPLSHGEWDTMKRHTEWGYVILNHADQELGEQSFLTLSSRIALFHHEKYDGSGYPRGLSGEDIPLSARISAIADVYDALRSKRPYKEPWSHQQTVDELVKNGGQQFDPSLIEIFKQVHPEFDHIKHEFED